MSRLYEALNRAEKTSDRKGSDPVPPRRPDAQQGSILDFARELEAARGRHRGADPVGAKPAREVHEVIAPQSDAPVVAAHGAGAPADVVAGAATTIEPPAAVTAPAPDVQKPAPTGETVSPAQGPDKPVLGAMTVTASVDAALTVCPNCGMACNPQPSTWARSVSLIGRIPAYRCSGCKRRFKAPRHVVPTAAHGPRKSVSGFLAADDDRSFDDLIKDMARDERERQQSNEARSNRDDGMRNGQRDVRDQRLILPTQGPGDRGDQ